MTDLLAESHDPEQAPLDDRVATVVPVDRADDVAAVCGRIDAAPTFAVVLHAPDGNRQLATQLGMRRLVRHAEDTGRVLAIATTSRALTARARQAGVPVSRRPERMRWDAGGKRVVWLGALSVALPGLGRQVQFVLLLTIIAAAAAAALTAGPSATIVATPPIDQFRTKVLITASAAITTVDLPAARLPARQVSTTRTVTLARAATGQAEVPAGRALVLVTLANTGSSDILVPEGAGLVSSPGGVTFVLDQETLVPAGKSVIQQASATEPGPSGNIPAGTLRRWEDARFAAVQVSNSEPAAGGSTEIRPGVSEADVSELRALAAALAASGEWQRALVEDRPDVAVFARTVSVTATPRSPSPAVGAPATVVLLDVDLVIRGLAVPRDELEALAAHLFAGQAPGFLVAGSVRAVETGQRQRDRAGEHTSEFIITAGFSHVTAADVRAAARGKSPSSARSTLLERYGIQDVDVDLVPGFMPWLPRFDFRIDVRLQVSETVTVPTSPSPNAEPTPRSPTPSQAPGP